MSVGSHPIACLFNIAQMLISAVVTGLLLQEELQNELYPMEIYTVMLGVVSFVLSILSCVAEAQKTTVTANRARGGTLHKYAKMARLMFLALFCFWLLAGAIEVWKAVELRHSLTPFVIDKAHLSITEVQERKRRLKLRAAASGLSLGTAVLFIASSQVVGGRPTPVDPQPC